MLLFCVIPAISPYIVYRQSSSRLEEVHLLTLIFASTSEVTVLKNLYSLYIHVIRPQRRKNNKVLLPPQKSNFTLQLALVKRDLNKQGFIFEVFRRWSLIRLVNLIHRYSYLIFQFIVSVSLEKPDITDPSLNSSFRFSRATFQSQPEDLGPC